MRTSGKLLGRSTTLWVSLIAAALNFVVVMGVVHLDAIQIGATNGFALLLVGILANEENPTVAGTFSGTMQAPEITIKKA
jgi:hypothetical protein